MSGQELNPIPLERAMERLRQERETFDQQKLQGERWFRLRLVMGYSAVMLLASVMVVSSYILLGSTKFAPEVVASAGAALFVDVLGLLIGVWKIVIHPESVTKLTPVTANELPLENQILVDSKLELPAPKDYLKE